MDPNAELNIDYWLLSDSGILWFSEKGYLGVLSFSPTFVLRDYSVIGGEPRRVRALAEFWREDASDGQIFGLAEEDPELTVRTEVFTHPTGEEITDSTHPHSVEAWFSLLNGYPSLSESDLFSDSSRILDLASEYVVFEEEVASADISSIANLVRYRDSTGQKAEIISWDRVSPVYGPDGQQLQCTLSN